MVTLPDSVLDVAANAEHAMAGLFGQLKASDVVDQVGTAATQAATQVGTAASHAYGAARHEVARQAAARQGGSCRAMPKKPVLIGVVSLVGLLALLAALRSRRARRLDQQTMRLA